MNDRPVKRNTLKVVLLALIFHAVATTGTSTAAFAEQRCVVVNHQPLLTAGHLRLVSLVLETRATFRPPMPTEYLDTRASSPQVVRIPPHVNADSGPPTRRTHGRGHASRRFKVHNVGISVNGPRG